MKVYVVVEQYNDDEDVTHERVVCVCETEETANLKIDELDAKTHIGISYFYSEFVLI